MQESETETASPDSGIAPAKDVATSTAELDRLASSDCSEIRRAVAENPNAPFKTLWKLVGEFPNEILNNSISSFGACYTLKPDMNCPHRIPRLRFSRTRIRAEEARTPSRPCDTSPWSSPVAVGT